jgi:beta-1,2-mannobiose phosphorylase / 1,2-beta-oligomannan phosphorylase
MNKKNLVRNMNENVINEEKAIYTIESRNGYFDEKKITVLDTLLIKGGVLVFYCTKAPFCLGAVLFDKKDNKNVLYRTANPIWESKIPVKQVKIKLSKDVITLHFNREDKQQMETFSLNYILGKDMKSPNGQKQPVKSVIKKSESNPIIQPDPKHNWESCGTFNATVVNINNKIHILYRAVGDNGSSVIGYATSSDGVNIDERLPYPIYRPTGNFELRINSTDKPLFSYTSGGTLSCWGGCEDPRIVRIDNMIYMVYTAFNGVNPPCVALTSIKVIDFLQRNWNMWKKPTLISPENQMNKNWVIFPEKINNKFVILHSIAPKIQIEYVDSLDFKTNPNIKSTYLPVRRAKVWDTIIRGIGPAPLKIDEGWLVFYHAISEREPSKYKIGAMILDYKDPTKILYRSNFPIIEPDKIYENEGYKQGIVYTCGAIIKDKNIILYYGGADTVVCVASSNLQNFIKQIKLNNVKI